ncbi:uncharacterized protein LOC100821820 [Brachypodium distachyon]|uniref:Uncharacterized protein n=1 Tax=Brachypodium distachyon TaxID=15368 RepID=A0A0Q3JCA2_BRADI|nr:uncharacterized protein LOC100821820 [Brachypodium distachyon]KQJ95960.1 hypothetical protein BRADI_3g19940v3 [Brachypodium distachyon]|eukprot:XP_003571623.1 uncharacterized protein LOC100821820 [Brachypodium distachyon]
MAMEYNERRGGCFSCCFGGGEAGEGGAGERASRALRASSRWMRDRAGELPELVARVRRPRRKQQLAGEFRYDPISYALNFEEDGEEEEPFKYRAFSSRLPASPSPMPLRDAAAALGRGS